MRKRAFAPTLALIGLAACASAPRPVASETAVIEDGWTRAPQEQQDGRIAMSVSCANACALGARLRAANGKALWISLAGEDHGAVYLQTLGAGEQALSQELLFRSASASPFPSDTPVFIEIGLKGAELTGWAGDGRIWGFAKAVEAAPEAGEWSVYHQGAAIHALRFENAQARPQLTARSGEGFTAQRINDLFYSETVSVGDVNRDGIDDIVTGGLYYLGPRFAQAHEIFPISSTDPNNYSTGLVSALDDIDGDGWNDLILIESGTPAGHPLLVYLNPRGQSRHWERVVALEHTASEAIAYVDIDRDGASELVVISENAIGLARPQADAREHWTFTPISERRERWNAHGIGVGDVDGDGRSDVLHGSGWLRQPESAGGAWTFTPAAFGFGAQLHVEDLNGDGRNDVIGSLDGHGFGLAWFEQTHEGAFSRRLIMGNPAQTPARPTLATFSQPHALAVADLNGDGLSDIVTGKRWWAHRDTYRDPDGQGAPVLYAFLQRRAGGAVRFEPHFIGDHVGVGNQIAAADLDGDRRPEIITAARKGAFIYRNGL